MSGAGPRGPGVGVGTFVGCQQPETGAADGQNTWYIAPSGTDADGCPTGGTPLDVDALNGIIQSLQCLLTQNNTVPLTNERLCENPCLIFDAITTLIGNSTSDPCTATPADAQEKNIIDPTSDTVVICLNGNIRSIPLECITNSAITPCNGNSLPIGYPGLITDNPNYDGGNPQITPPVGGVGGVGSTFIATGNAPLDGEWMVVGSVSYNPGNEVGLVTDTYLVKVGC